MNESNLSKIKVLENDWYSNKDGHIGIVLFYNGYGKIKCKIKKVSGTDIQFDTYDVIRWGSSFPLDAAFVLFNTSEEIIKKKLGI